MTEITTLNATLEYGKEKLDALHVYLKQSDAEFQATLNTAAAESLDALYKKNVPTAVQAFISLMCGEVKSDKKVKSKKPKTIKKEDPEYTLAETINTDDNGGF
ncbi:MAG: hypothetical protein RRY38_02030 [Oscillospiraceae bacterium]